MTNPTFATRAIASQMATAADSARRIANDIEAGCYCDVTLPRLIEQAEMDMQQMAQHIARLKTELNMVPS